MERQIIIISNSIRTELVLIDSKFHVQVSSVQWSVTRQEQLVLSSSWDSSVRVWDPQALSCVGVFGGHAGNVYAACWSPHLPHTFASVAGV